MNRGAQVEQQCPELNSPLDGRYQVVQILAVRLWGRTYLAQDLRRPSQPECIIHYLKPLPGEEAQLTLMRQLFVQEAAVLERLSVHPQLPQLLACFETDQGFYLVQELIAGLPLDSELQPSQPWRSDQVLGLLLNILEPLAFMHQQGVWHGDLQPKNLMRSPHPGPGYWVVIGGDGLRQIPRSLSHLSEQMLPLVESVLQGYQPPEYVLGLPTLASDVYALGMIAIQALTGVHPAQLPANPDTGQVDWQHQLTTTDPLSQILAEVLSQMVYLDPLERLPDALAVLQQLQQAIGLSSPQGQPIPWDCPLPSEQLLTAVPVTSPKGAKPTQIEVTEPNNLSAPILTEQPPGSLVVVPPSPSSQSLGSIPWRTSIAAAVTVTIGSWAVLNGLSSSKPEAQAWATAQEYYQAGQIDKALRLAKSIARDNTTYQQAQAAIAQWESLRQARQKADLQASQRLQNAYALAIAHEFTAALAELQQIPPGTALAETVQLKQQEYTEKQTIRAQAMLQEAYIHAENRDFGGAINYLRQIPVGVKIYDVAQTKIAEYVEKQQIQANVWLQIAEQYGREQNWSAALAALHKIPPGGPQETQVNAKLTDYTARLNQLANQRLQTAIAHANRGDFTKAIALLEQVPLGTIAYAQARDKQVEYSQKQGGNRPQLELNPGDILQEVLPLSQR